MIQVRWASDTEPLGFRLVGRARGSSCRVRIHCRTEPVARLLRRLLWDPTLAIYSPRPAESVLWWQRVMDGLLLAECLGPGTAPRVISRTERTIHVPGGVIVLQHEVLDWGPRRTKAAAP